MMHERSHAAEVTRRPGREVARYDRDLYGWAVEQAALLRAGRVEEALGDAYADARIQATAQTRLDEQNLPDRSPYSWQQIIERPVVWPPKS